MFGPNELRMYILLNSSAKMKPGKAVSQACHATSKMTEHLIKYDPELWEKYKKGSHTKISLKCSEDDLFKIYDKYKDRSNKSWCLNVKDEGRTQVPRGTVTALIFKPTYKVDIPEELNSFKLY